MNKRKSLPPNTCKISQPLLVIRIQVFLAANSTFTFPPLNHSCKSHWLKIAKYAENTRLRQTMKIACVGGKSQVPRVPLWS